MKSHQETAHEAIDGSPAHSASSLRTKQACDLCRQRKVKCLSTQHSNQCQGCLELGAQCTHDRPRRRRGPPNRRAEAHKALNTDDVSECSPYSESQVRTQPLSNETEYLATFDQLFGRSTNSILGLLGSIEVVHQILNDWFKLVHPLAPVLHRQRLLERLQDHGGDNDPVFAALLVSVCAVTVSTLRRESFEKYPSVTVEKCARIIEDGKLLQSQPLTLDWCIAWYNVASALSVDFGPGNYRSYRAIREAMTGVNWLLLQKGDEQPFQSKELLKRLYWLLYMWQVGAEIQGQTHLTFLPSGQDFDHLRPKDLTDRELYPSFSPRPGILSWPEDDVHLIPGFNSLVDVFLTWEHGKSDQLCMQPATALKSAVDRIQDTLDRLPPEFRWQGRSSYLTRRVWSHDVQTINILITALSLKSNFLQHLGLLVTGLSHRDIASDLLEILDHLPQTAFEANGYSAVVKIRDIGAAYLAELNQGSGGLEEDAKARGRMVQLLESLKSLDFRPHQEPPCGRSEW